MAKEKKEEVKSDVSDQIANYLKDHKDDHYNFEETVNYKVSSGSLMFDLELGGGFGPGVHRFTGCSESGKSSVALTVGRNFQLTIPNSMVVYFKAEGRLSPDMLSRSGINMDKDKFFIYESNIFESVSDLMQDLVKNNPSNKKYLFVIDSLDSLIPRGELTKSSGDAAKVAGPAVLGKDMLKRMTLALQKRGHILLLISQVSTAIKINPYEKTDPRLTNASGGNAMNHFPDTMIEFQQRFKKDLILDKDEKIIGHHCRMIFKKSTNEKTGVEVSYPIKYKRTNGQSVWKELEVFDMMLSWDMIKKGGAWFNLDAQVHKELMVFDKELPEKFQGENNVKEYLETHPEISNYLFDKFKKTLTKT